jgi:hypothetical protein
MFPNPQDALPLPLRPNLEQYKKLAKDLVHACKSGEPDAMRTWTDRWVHTLTRLSKLTITPELPVRIERWIDQLDEFALRRLKPSGADHCVLSEAQFVIAQAHGFESWPQFAKHVEGLSRISSLVTKFELAADAIVSGDVATIERLLRENSDLIRVRSTREHRATLLHYVSANGVEGYRQKTPKNAARIAEMLIRFGAEVDAEADVYGGGATTLGLVATSVHPERAGVQEELMRVLLDHGAKIDRPGVAGNRHDAVAGCLANGRAKAAEFLANHSARLSLDTAAGVGRLDILNSFFGDDGRPKGGATRAQMQQGFLWACQYGRTAVVENLLEKDAGLLNRADNEQTALHCAVIGAHLEIVKLLLARGASLERKNVYGGTALGQALWSAINGNGGRDYVPIIEMLIDAGATIAEGSLTWLARQAGGSSATKERIGDVLRRHGATS